MLFYCVYVDGVCVSVLLYAFCEFSTFFYSFEGV